MTKITSSLLLATTFLFVLLTIIITNQNNKIDAAPIAQTFCTKIVESAAFSSWCGASGGCRVDAPFYSLCSGRGSCLIRSSDPSTTTNTLCTDCSWTLTGPNAGGDVCPP